MRIYLNAGFGEPLGQANVELILSLGFAGIRTDVLDNGHQDTVVHEIATNPRLEAILLAHDRNGAIVSAQRVQDLGLQSRVVVEILNEPDFTSTTPEELAALVTELCAMFPAVRFVTGGVSHRGQDYLRRMMAAGVPARALVGFHTYRNTPPETPLPGYPSRAAEFAQLENLASGRPLWCTECGWHTARFRTGPWWRPRYHSFTDEEVAQFVRRELTLHRDAGVEVFVLYQFNDGPTNTAPNRFGIRRTDGTLKPVAAVIQEFAPPPPPVPPPAPGPTQMFPIVGCTDFRLPQLQMAGEHDRLRQILNQRRACGFTHLRVLAMKWNNTGWELNPDGRPLDRFFNTDIPRFMDTVIPMGFKVLWNALNDTRYPWGWSDSNKQVDYWLRTEDALRPYADYIILARGNEVANPYHQSIDFSRIEKPVGFISSAGSSTEDATPIKPMWDVAEYGARRKKHGSDGRIATSYSPLAFEEDYPKPIPFYASEGEKPENYGFDKRMAKLMGLHAACGDGGVFHHSYGIAGELFPPEVEACARAFVEGLTR